MGNPAGERRKSRLKRHKREIKKLESKKLLHEFFGFPFTKGCPLCVAGIYHGSVVSQTFYGQKIPPDAKGIPIDACEPGIEF